MSYQFAQIREILLSILTYVWQADADMNERGVTATDLRRAEWQLAYQYEFVTPISVQGPVRGQTEPVSTQMPLVVEIEPVAPEPMGLPRQRFFRNADYWNVNIKLPPMDRSLGGHCFYMGLLVPRNMATVPNVLVSWLYQIMIDPDTHSQVPPAFCLGPDVPNYQWGTLFMQLYEVINQLLATEVHPLVLGGLVDDAFVQYCGHAVVFSDMRRFQGQAPWYETFGFKMANEEEYRLAMQAASYAQARQSVEQHYQEYVQILNSCTQSPMPAEEKALFCKNDPVCGTMQTRKDVARHIAEAIRGNDEQHGCSWVSDNAPLTCLTQFNRHYNPQTLHLLNEKRQVEDVVVRLKFYNA